MAIIKEETRRKYFEPKKNEITTYQNCGMLLKQMEVYNTKIKKEFYQRNNGLRFIIEQYEEQIKPQIENGNNKCKQ